MNEEQFLDYCLLFYGAGGLYDMGATREEVRAALRLREKLHPEIPFGADSVDRELVRDVMTAERAAA